MLSRRAVLSSGLAAIAFRNDTLDVLDRLLTKVGTVDAQDEGFWSQVQQAFDLDRNLVNLNNGGCSPSPRVVQDMFRRQLALSNQAPSYYMWRQLEQEVESVRRGLARAFGCDAEEIAITRNASEALETCLLGIDLEPGDEILTTWLDYPRMITTIQQRERRDGVKMAMVRPPAVPTRLEELEASIRAGITPRTRMILISHVSFLNGQIFPVEAISRLAAERKIPLVVDGAHAFAQFAFRQPDLKCEMYGTSLHKWLMAPVGTGFLYVRRDRIPNVWPLMPATHEQRADIRKFEEIGTHPAANHNAIGEALTFHEMLGAERKESRLRYLRQRWTEPLRALPKVRFQTNLDARHSCALTTLSIDGITGTELAEWLLSKHGIFVTAIDSEPVKGIRVTPNVYTTLGEIDRLKEALLTAATKGIG